MRILLFLAMFVVHGSLFAQGINKGSVMVGGGFSVSYASFRGDDWEAARRFSFNLSPSGGIFIKKNLSLGCSLGFGYSNYTLRTPLGADSSKVLDFRYSLSPSLSYYKFFGSKFGMALTAALPLNFNVNEDFRQRPEYVKSYSYSIGTYLIPSLCFMPNDRWLFSTSIGNANLSHMSFLDSKGDEQSGRFSANINFGMQFLYINVSHFLNRKANEE